MADHPEWSEALVDTRVMYHVERDGRLFVIENVPARTNVETGENHFSPETVERLHKIMREPPRPRRMIRMPVYEFDSGCNRIASPPEQGMHEFGINLYWSDEDQTFVAEVPELPGCMAHGASQESALRNVKEAMQLWVDTAREFGDPIPQPKSSMVVGDPRAP